MGPIEETTDYEQDPVLLEFISTMAKETAAKANETTPVASINTPKVSSASRLDKLKTLHFNRITSSSETVGEDMRRLAALYQHNLMPDAAFQELIETGTTDSLEGMLNRWRPNDHEMEFYPLGYESVADQMHKDMLLSPERFPGEYRVYAMSCATGDARASLSCRLPPLDRSQLPQYNEYLRQKVFGNQWFKFNNNQATENLRSILDNDKSSLMEIDTINVDKEYRGAGKLLVQNALNDIAVECAEADVPPPDGVFYYRFAGFKVKEFLIEGLSDRITPTEKIMITDVHEVCPNLSSHIFFAKLGFEDFGERIEKDVERVVREIPGFGTVVMEPKWVYGFSKWRTVNKRAAGSRKS